jgi:two-component sensor histidine kinase
MPLVAILLPLIALAAKWMSRSLLLSANAELKTIQEKQEILLKEIHHRVKNNLQVVSSLLFLQSTSTPQDSAIQGVLKESQGRIKSIALIHEKLYRSRGLEKLAFADYVRDLLSDLVRTYGAPPGVVSVQTDTEEISLGVDSAIPCGLIINELISNAFKHAFPGGRRGEVRVTIRKIPGGNYLLNVCDNGVGMANTHHGERSHSLGLKLVADLTKQINGTLTIDNRQGTDVQILFHEGTSRVRK